MWCAHSAPPPPSSPPLSLHNCSVLGVGLEEAVQGMREGGRRLVLVDGTQGHGQGRFYFSPEQVGLHPYWRALCAGYSVVDVRRLG